MVVNIIATAIANILICFAFGMVRTLQKPQHYLVVSLAVTDLFVSLLVSISHRIKFSWLRMHWFRCLFDLKMIPTMLYEIFDEWIFGPTFCDLWIFSHQLSVTASILTLCALSVDRYLAITKPLGYSVNRTAKRMILLVAMTWLGGACVSLPPLIFGNIYFDEELRSICLVYQDIGYQIYATVVGFYIPFTVMMFMYYRIYREARRIAIEEKRVEKYIEGLLCEVPEGESIQATRTTIICTLFAKGKKFRLKLAKHYKATTVLGLLVFAFALCWLPFYVLALARLIIQRDNFSNMNTLSLLFLWLGFLNSLLDPIINATMHQEFRKPIREILSCRCSTLNVVVRESNYRRSFNTPRRSAEHNRRQSNVERQSSWKFWFEQINVEKSKKYASQYLWHDKFVNYRNIDWINFFSQFKEKSSMQQMIYSRWVISIHKP